MTSVRVTPGVLVLPWPSRDLSPNGRVHWRRRAQATQGARADAFHLAKMAGWHGIQLPAGRLHLWWDFYSPTRCYPDDDNMLSRCKAYRDGLADALGINDRRFISHPFVREEVRKGGQVVVRITHDPQEVADVS